MGDSVIAITVHKSKEIVEIVVVKLVIIVYVVDVVKRVRYRAQRWFVGGNVCCVFKSADSSIVVGVKVLNEEINSHILKLTTK